MNGGRVTVDHVVRERRTLAPRKRDDCITLCVLGTDMYGVW